MWRCCWNGRWQGNEGEKHDPRRDERTGYEQADMGRHNRQLRQCPDPAPDGGTDGTVHEHVVVTIFTYLRSRGSLVLPLKCSVSPSASERFSWMTPSRWWGGE